MFVLFVLLAQLQTLVSQLEAIAANEQSHKERSTGPVAVHSVVVSWAILLLSVLRIFRPLLLCEARGAPRALRLCLAEPCRRPCLCLRALTRACRAVSRLGHGRASAAECAACVRARAYQESAAGQR